MCSYPKTLIFELSMWYCFNFGIFKSKVVRNDDWTEVQSTSNTANNIDHYDITAHAFSVGAGRSDS